MLIICLTRGLLRPASEWHGLLSQRAGLCPKFTLPVLLVITCTFWEDCMLEWPASTWWGRGHLCNREYFLTLGHLICFDYQSLLLREPFRDDAAWDEQCLAFQPHDTVSSDRAEWWGGTSGPHHPELGVRCVVSWRNSQGGAA